MKTKKFWIILTVIVCSLAIIAGAITAAVFAVRACRQAEGRSRAEQYMSELSAYSPDTDISDIRLDLNAYTYTGESVFDTEFDNVYDKIERADSSMGITFSLSLNDNNPTMRLSVDDQIQRVGSVYLYNGKLYVCPYDDDYFVENERIAAIYDAQDLFGGFDWSQMKFDDWQNIQTEVDLDRLFELLGIEDAGQMDMLSSLAEDPEKLFIDARKEENTQLRYVFNLDVSYFESYFEQIEGEIGEQYQARFSDKSVCMFVSLQETQLRMTMALSEKIAFGANSQSIVTAFDILLDIDADKTYIPNDVYAYERFSHGLVESDVDRSDESLTTIESGTVQQSYQLDLWTDLRCSYGVIGDGMLVIYNEGRADIFSLDGYRVRTLEYLYNIVGIYDDGNYATVVLGEPIVDYRYAYLFRDNILPGGYNYRCITYDLSDFSVVSEVILETDYKQEIKVARQCDDTFVFGGDGWCYFIDVLGGDYVCNTDFYTLRKAWHYDRASDRIWLYDYYVGAVVIDLKNYSYSYAEAMPETEKYIARQTTAEGYDYVNCFAPWQGYELAFARADGNYYLVIYDGQVDGVVASLQVDYTVNHNFFVTDEDKLVWWGNNVLYVADLNALLLQE